VSSAQLKKPAFKKRPGPPPWRYRSRHPEAANQLISDNVKEMSNPTRVDRAMIAAGMIHPAGLPLTRTK
jgi:hypothetical protein